MAALLANQIHNNRQTCTVHDSREEKQNVSTGLKCSIRYKIKILNSITGFHSVYIGRFSQNLFHF